MLKTDAFRPNTGTSYSCAMNVEYASRLTILSVRVVAANDFQTPSRPLIASCAEPARPFFGARPYHTISAHRAPAEVPLKPTSSNRFRSVLPSALFCCSMFLRISIRTPTEKEACIPPPDRQRRPSSSSSHPAHLSCVRLPSPTGQRTLLTRAFTRQDADFLLIPAKAAVVLSISCPDFTGPYLELLLRAPPPHPTR